MLNMELRGAEKVGFSHCSSLDQLSAVTRKNMDRQEQIPKLSTVSLPTVAPREIF